MSTTQASFNPRAREGRDLHLSQEQIRRPSFNPRAREGRDSHVQWVAARNIVSIHAPVKGATSVPSPQLIAVWCFNPRAREGRDVTLRSVQSLELVFQSTRP